jgi:hypothetical protein
VRFRRRAVYPRIPPVEDASTCLVRSGT